MTWKIYQSAVLLEGFQVSVCLQRVSSIILDLPWKTFLSFPNCNGVPPSWVVQFRGTGIILANIILCLVGCLILLTWRCFAMEKIILALLNNKTISWNLLFTLWKFITQLTAQLELAICGMTISWNLELLWCLKLFLRYLILRANRLDSLSSESYPNKKRKEKKNFVYGAAKLRNNTWVFNRISHCLIYLLAIISWRHEILLPVIVSPNGMRGRLTGYCPGDLVKQVYFR